jgi:hypothetical protein
MREIRDAYKIVVGKPEGNRLLGIHMHKWESNNKKFWEELICLLFISIYQSFPNVCSLLSLKSFN